MPFYKLEKDPVDPSAALKCSARDLGEALAIFGKMLGQKLSREDSDDAVAWYLLDEWEESIHFVNYHIRVFAVPLG
jgi:hypothetical protein